VDVAHLIHPQYGPFSAFVSTDKFALYVSGAVLLRPANARNIIEAFLSSTLAAYARVTYDLGTNFRNTDFKMFLERLGSEAWAVAADAHWPLAAEKSIEWVRVELDAAVQEFLDLLPAAVFQITIHRLNSRALWACNVTHATVLFRS
jgi:hypothetical protein